MYLSRAHNHQQSTRIKCTRMCAHTTHWVFDTIVKRTISFDVCVSQTLWWLRTAVTHCYPRGSAIISRLVTVRDSLWGPTWKSWDFTTAFLHEYCSTVQGLLDWFEADRGFTKLFEFRLICVLSVFPSPTLSSRPPLVLFGRRALPPRAVEVPLESALNLVSLFCSCLLTYIGLFCGTLFALQICHWITLDSALNLVSCMCLCGAHATRFAVLRVKITQACCMFQMKELTIRVFIEVRITYSSQHTATHCNTLQHTATHCNTLQHTATHCNT